MNSISKVVKATKITDFDSVFGVPSKDFYILFIFYVFAHAYILFLGNAAYWDDWSLIGASENQIFSTFFEAGSLLNLVGWLHFFLLKFNPIIYKILTFFIYFLTGILVYTVTKRDVLKRGAPFWISLFYLITPLYIARVVLIDFPYTLCVFLFFLGWLFIKKNVYLALLFFLASFNTPSLLVFYSVPIYFCFIKERSLARIKLITPNFILFLISPFLWFYIKTHYYKPSGNYEGYNEQFDLRNLVSAPYLQWRDFHDFAYTHIYKGFINPYILTVFLVCLSLINIWKPPFFVQKKEAFLLFFLGILLLLLGLFPYWILGYVPTFDGWTSRHQLLMPLGCSFMLIGILGAIRLDNYPQITQKIPQAIIITVCLAINTIHYKDLHEEWEAEKNIINFMKASPIIKDSTLILFENHGFKAFDQRYAFYEWNGILHQAFPMSRDKFGIEHDELNLYKTGKFDKEFKRFFITENHVKSLEKIALVKISQVNGFTMINITRLPAPN